MSLILQDVIAFLPYAYVIPEGNVRRQLAQDRGLVIQWTTSIYSKPRTAGLVTGTFVPTYFRSFASKSESTIGETFAPGSESYMELSLPGTFAPECDK